MSIAARFFRSGFRSINLPRRRRSPGRCSATLEALEARVLLTLVVGFEDLGLALAPESAFYGPLSDGDEGIGPFGDNVVSGAFQSGGLSFNNTYSLDFGSWAGFAYSNITDNTTPGFGNQWSAIPGSGADNSPTYGIVFAGDPIAPTIQRGGTTSQASFRSIDLTNTTYTVLSMMNGDFFSKKFGGDSGDDPDFLLLTIEGRDGSGSSVGTIDVYLADFRFENNSLDYILDQWMTIDVSELVGATQLEFSMSSSDVGPWGMNTPAFFAIDNITLDVPNSPPEVQLVNRVTTVDEGPVVSAIKVADILITDDGIGTYVITLAGRDAALFQIHGNELQLRPGIMLDFETLPTLEVAVQVDDPEVGGSPDDVAFMTVTINNIDDEDDLVLIDSAGQTVLVRNNGQAFTQSPGPDWAGTGANRFFTGDFTGDSRQDLLGITPDGQLFVSLGTADGFQAPALWGNWSAGQFANDVNIGDFNGDGRDDVIARGNDGQWRLQRSLGSRFELIAGPRWSATGFVDGQAVVGDFDGDGFDDVALRLTTGGWYVAFGTTAGLVTQYVGRWNETDYSWFDLRVGDFNGDGRADIIARNQLGGLFIMQMNGTREFTMRHFTRWNPDLGWRDVIIADFNNDGLDDVAAWEQRGIWWLTPGTPETSAMQAFGRWSSTISWKGTIGDFNGDNMLDVVGLDQATGNWWLLFNRDGKLQTTRFWGKLTGNTAQSQLLASLEK